MFSGFYTLAQALMYSDLHTTPLKQFNHLKIKENFLNFFEPFFVVFGQFTTSSGGMAALPHLGFHRLIAGS